MKKFFIVLAVCVAAVACNSTSADKVKYYDSISNVYIQKARDAITVAQTTLNQVDSVKGTVVTVIRVLDSAKVKLDSAQVYKDSTAH